MNELEIRFLVDEVEGLRVENARLRAGMEEYACTGTDKPCGCYALLSKEKTEIAKLRAALEPFARNADNVSLSGALGHICRLDREDLLRARAALEKTK